jgi:hypothetical protein
MTGKRSSDYRPSRPRHREILYPRTSVRYLENWFKNGTFQGVVADNPALVPQSGRWMDDVVVDRYRERSALGEVIINPMRSVIADWSTATADGTWTLTTPGNVSDYVVTGLVDGLHRMELFPPAPELEQWKLDAARDEAITRCYRKVNSSGGDLLVDLAGLKQTVSMLVSAGKRLISLASSIRNFLRLLTAPTPADWRVLLNAFSVGQDVPLPRLAGLWCELRFGWGPLLRSIDAVAEVLSGLDSEGQVQRLTYRAAETVTFSQTSENILYVHPLPDTTWTRVYSVDVDRTVIFRAGAIADVRYSTLTELGLSWSAFPTAVWDVVPFSFIVDRFLNIADFIRSRMPKPGVVIQANPWLVTRDISTIVWNSEYVPASSSSSAGTAFQPGAHSALRSTSSITTRENILGPPISPVLRHDWASITSLLNAIDGIALAIQQMRPPR